MKKTLEEIRFGVEIEVEFPDSEDSFELIKKNRVIKGWKIDDDGSLDNGAEYKALDRNKLYYNKDSLVQIKEILALIKVHKGNIKPSCGLHIHIDAKPFKDIEVYNIIKNFQKQQSQIIKDFCVLKSRIHDTAGKITNADIKELSIHDIKKLRAGNYMIGDAGFCSDKYKLLNINSLSIHHTLEFRLFNGTIQYRRIAGHIKWAINFCLENCK